MKHPNIVTTGRWPTLAVIITLLIGPSGATSGRDNGPANRPSQVLAQKNVAVQSAQTPLELALARWRAGDKSGAVVHFLAIDWKTAKSFSPKSPLAVQEKDLIAMAAPDRDRLMGEAMALIKDLKELGNAVKERGSSAAGTDQKQARVCFLKLQECGTALDTPEALKILRLTAQVLQKTGATEAAKVGK